MSDRYLLLRGKTTSFRIALPPYGNVRIGRDEKNDLVVDEPGVEAFHIVLHYDAKLGLEVVAGEVQLAGRENATLSAGASRDVELEDRIRMGSVEVVVRPAEEPTNDAYVASEGGQVIATSAAMRAVIEMATALSQTDGSVLILGETGTGKDVVAQLIHDGSKRTKLVRKSCADLLDSTLDDAVLGEAKGGTMLLDEVGGLSARAQLSLAHVLERDPDVRFIFTSNHDLEDDVEAGRLRKDLFFRINRARIDVPPLRDRADDIEPLARHFADKDLTPAAIETLSAHSWPGNVRELQNVVERAHLESRGDKIDAVHIHLEASPAPLPSGDAPTSLRDEMAALEKRRILEALDKYPTQTEAAKALDIPLRTFLNRLDALGIQRARKSKT